MKVFLIIVHGKNYLVLAKSKDRALIKFSTKYPSFKVNRILEIQHEEVFEIQEDEDEK
jgi:hypothetical protein